MTPKDKHFMKWTQLPDGEHPKPLEPQKFEKAIKALADTPPISNEEIVKRGKRK